MGLEVPSPRPIPTSGLTFFSLVHFKTEFSIRAAAVVPAHGRSFENVRAAELQKEAATSYEAAVSVHPDGKGAMTRG
jgi:hypothetical protein